jgi:hypothetical protein
VHVKRVKLLWVVEVGKPPCFSVAMKEANTWPELYCTYRGADTSLARPASLAIVQGTGGSPTWPDLENSVGYQDTGSPSRPVSSGLQTPGEPFPSWSG